MIKRLIAEIKKNRERERIKLLLSDPIIDILINSAIDRVLNSDKTKPKKTHKERIEEAILW